MPSVTGDGFIVQIPPESDHGARGGVAYRLIGDDGLEVVADGISSP